MNMYETIKSYIGELTAEEKISMLTDVSAGVDRLGLPRYNWWNEALHGVARAGYATVFPQAIGLAAAFDTELMGKIARAIGLEARAKYNNARLEGNTDRYYGLTFWSPNVNIFRDPRWGRGQETY
ncbi:MAG: glycoside hydrolase family 3 protein, partial [Clostridia bacterium]|nr:glycoside hydrolase family 3 protein [Clostridia bacterium]